MLKADVDISWEVFKETFLEKYFLEDIKNWKKMEFLKLKYGGRIVAEYLAMF